MTFESLYWLIWAVVHKVHGGVVVVKSYLAIAEAQGLGLH